MSVVFEHRTMPLLGCCIVGTLRGGTAEWSALLPRIVLTLHGSHVYNVFACASLALSAFFEQRVPCGCVVIAFVCTYSLCMRFRFVSPLVFPLGFTSLCLSRMMWWNLDVILVGRRNGATSRRWGRLTAGLFLGILHGTQACRAGFPVGSSSWD